MNKYIIAVPWLRLTFATPSKQRSGLEPSLFSVRYVMDKSDPEQIFLLTILLHLSVLLQECLHNPSFINIRRFKNFRNYTLQFYVLYNYIYLIVSCIYILYI